MLKGYLLWNLPLQTMRMGERNNQKDTEDKIEGDVEEDEVLAEEVRDAETTSSRTPGEGDGVVLGNGLVVIRQPKQSDTDLATAEVSTVSLAPAHLPCKHQAGVSEY